MEQPDNTLAYEQVFAEMAELIRSKPDGYSYMTACIAADLSDFSCRYSTSKDGETVPLCIVGQWAHRFHPDLYKQIDRFGGAVTRAAEQNIWNIRLDAIELLQDLQDQQDCGVPWGLAIKKWNHES